MKIYTLVIDHRHGTNIQTFLSEEDMYETLHAYVKENWFDVEDISSFSREDAIEAYFQDSWTQDWFVTEQFEFPELVRREQHDGKQETITAVFRSAIFTTDRTISADGEAFTGGILYRRFRR